MLNPFDAHPAQPCAPHVGHSPPLILLPWQVSQEGDIFLLNGVEDIGGMMRDSNNFQEIRTKVLLRGKGDVDREHS